MSEKIFNSDMTKEERHQLAEELRNEMFPSLVVDVNNRNCRRYSKEALQKAIDDLNKMAEETGYSIFGEVADPNKPRSSAIEFTTVSMENTAFSIKHVDLVDEDDEIKIKGTITPEDSMINIIDTDIPVKFGIRAIGSPNKDSLKIITIDLIEGDVNHEK